MRTLMPVLLALLAGCAGPANEAAPESAKVPDPAPQANEPAPAAAGHRNLGSQQLLSLKVEVLLMLPWKSGDAPSFVVTVDGGNTRLTGWLEDGRGERLTQPAAMLRVEGKHHFTPVVSDLQPGAYVLAARMNAGLGTETLRFIFQLP